MKKTAKTRIFIVLASVCMFLGFSVSPFLANAEVEKVESIESIESNKIFENVDSSEDITINDSTNEKTEVTIDLNDITYEKFLEIVGILANETGNGELWGETLNSVKKAINEKQFTASNLLMIFVSVVMVIKIIYDWVIKRKEKTHVLQAYKTDKKIDAQSEAINGIIDEEEEISKTAHENATREKELAMAGLEQNGALRCLVRGIQLHDTAREEALRHLNHSDELFEKAKE